MPSASVPPSARAVDTLARPRIGDPDFWLSIACWLVVALSALQILLFSFGRDQSIYAVVGDGILHGKMPYRDLWDFKPPGIFLIYAAAEQLFGRTMLAPRLLEVAGLVGAVFGLRRLAHVFFGMRRIGLVGGAVAALTHAQLEFWHTGQPEAFGGFLTIYALVLTVSEYAPGRRALAWAGAGALFGAAFLLKPPLGGGALVCAVYLARREWVRTGSARAAAWPVVVVGLASLAPLLATAMWFRAAGAWEALRWTFADFTPGYTKLGWAGSSAGGMFYHALTLAFTHYSALALFGVVAAIAMRAIHTREREGLGLILGVVSIHLTGIAMQGKFFQYHFSATLPLVAFIAGLGLYKLWRRCLPGGAGGVVAFASFVVVAVSMRQAVNDLPHGSFWERSRVRLASLLAEHGSGSRVLLDRDLYYVADYDLDADRRVALELEAHTSPSAKIFVWGFEPGIYWLSNREPASRFIYDVPQRVSWQRESARASLMEDLRRNPPAMIVVQRNDVFPFVTGDNVDSAGALAGFPALDALVRDHYRRMSELEDFTLYQRLDE
ncbi:MAG: glycosyltransferase family 39 protein [Sorangiineae bacterium]|nr:glycosyltransferase family 39 protein [Polyangiaceae bacterium]MEB2321802.1 glycosyltransferase family 39 protein [Sorangiineae bacterium]